MIFLFIRKIQDVFLFFAIFYNVLKFLCIPLLFISTKPFLTQWHGQNVIIFLLIEVTKLNGAPPLFNLDQLVQLLNEKSNCKNM